MAKKAKSRKRGNPNIAQESLKHDTRFKKGDPRTIEIARKGGRRLPKLKDLMDALLGGAEGETLEETPIGQIVQALVKEVKNQKLGAQRVAAAKEVLDRAFGKVRDKENGGDEEAKRLPITGFNIKRKA